MTETTLEMTKERLFSALLDDLTTSVVAALRADSVVEDGCTAVRAGAQGRDGSGVMRTALVSSLLGDFVFRMCHGLIFLNLYFSSKKAFESGKGILGGSVVRRRSVRLPAKISDGICVALSVRVDPVKRKRKAGVVVDHLGHIEDRIRGVQIDDLAVTLHHVGLSGSGLAAELDAQQNLLGDRELQRLEASVANGRDRAFEVAVDTDVTAGLLDHDLNGEVCIENLSIPVTLKELFIGLPGEFALSGRNPVQR